LYFTLDYNIKKQLTLLIVGNVDKYCKKRIECLIKKDSCGKNIIFTGRKNKDELKSYYSISNCFVFPSRWEGSPRVLKEALAYKIPIIATDISGNRIIDKKGQFIDFFPPGDYIELSRKITKYYYNQEKYNKRGIMGYDRIKKYNNLDYIANKYYKFYNSLIN